MLYLEESVGNVFLWLQLCGSNLLVMENPWKQILTAELNDIVWGDHNLSKSS